MKVVGYRERVARYFDSIANTYDERIYDHNLGFDDLYWDIVEELEWYWIRKYLPESGVVLDAAGGTGRLAVKIANDGRKVFLLDISPKMVEIAKKKAKKLSVEKFMEFQIGDIHNLPYPENFFDMVLGMGIEYADNLPQVIAEFKRVAKPNRYVIFSVDSLLFLIIAFINLGLLDNALDIIEKRTYEDSKDVLCWTYTPSELKKMCLERGLIVEKIVGFGVSAYIKDKELRIKIHKNSKMKQKLLEIEKKVSTVEDFAPIANHIIVICKKPPSNISQFSK